MAAALLPLRQAATSCFFYFLFLRCIKCNVAFSRHIPSGLFCCEGSHKCGTTFRRLKSLRKSWLEFISLNAFTAGGARER